MQDPTIVPLVRANANNSRVLLFWLAWIVWLAFLIPAVAALFGEPRPWPALVAGLAGGALFVAIYLRGSWRNVQRLVVIPPPSPSPTWQVWLPIGALLVLSIALTSFNGLSWGGTFIYTSAYAAGRLPPLRALPVVGLLVSIVGWGEWLHGLDSGTIISAMVLIGIVGVVVMGMVQGMLASRDLRLAQEEIARLAVTTERLRIARDLHDLLGHNLTLIALKADLAGGLARQAPERAAAESADIAQAARATLQQVREALAGYRQPVMAGELAAAREILAAAGIAFRYEGPASPGEALPPTVAAVLAWTIREGVTNVVKHSRAPACVIRVTQDTPTAGVEVADNGGPSAGRDGSGAAGATTGPSGLGGLAERVRTLGGHFEAGPAAEGFRLAVTLPLTAGNAERSVEG